MRKNWRINRPDAILSKRIKHDLGISSFLAGLLVNRGITESSVAKEFLDPGLSCLHDAVLLPDIDKAAKRIFKALKNSERVILFSDYDADGLTALAVLKIAFKKLGLSHQHYLPHRLKEGYGLNSRFVNYAHDSKAGLVITLDCGIANFKEIEELKKFNIDTIVVDHHQPLAKKLPCAYAVINPKREDSSYPFKELAGVGLSYKLASYLLGNLLEEELDLVCLGTIADVVPLIGENRILAKNGLKRLNDTRRKGLSSLMEVAGIINKEITANSVGFILGPRINACGRLDSCEAALSLLLSTSDEEARALARELQSRNQERQRIEGKIMIEALGRIEVEVDFSKERVIVLSGEDWHQGVLGIVAAKSSNRFYRPAIIISFAGDIGKGSARSIDNFHLFEGLMQCAEHLLGFGGHKHAAGLSIYRKDIDNFKKSINRFAFEKLSHEDLLPVLDIDFELKPSDFSHSLLEDIKLLEPFGEANPRPLFLSSNLEIKSRPLVLGRDTLKFWVSCGKAAYPAVGFRMGNYLDLVSRNKTVDLAYRLSLDTYNGNNQLQLEIEDIRLPLS